MKVYLVIFLGKINFYGKVKTSHYKNGALMHVMSHTRDVYSTRVAQIHWGESANTLGDCKVYGVHYFRYDVKERYKLKNTYADHCNITDW